MSPLSLTEFSGGFYSVCWHHLVEVTAGHLSRIWNWVLLQNTQNWQQGEANLEGPGLCSVQNRQFVNNHSHHVGLQCEFNTFYLQLFPNAISAPTNTATDPWMVLSVLLTPHARTHTHSSPEYAHDQRPQNSIMCPVRSDARLNLYMLSRAEKLELMNWVWRARLDSFDSTQGPKVAFCETKM
jgi:hypothetical protein